MEGFETPEITINPYQNFDNKLSYYKRDYNEELTLKPFNEIKIVGFSYGDDYSKIQNDLSDREEI